MFVYTKRSVKAFAAENKFEWVEDKSPDAVQGSLTSSGLFVRGGAMTAQPGESGGWVIKGRLSSFASEV